MILRSTSVFRKSLRELTKKPKYGYSSCPIDICDELAGKEVEDMIRSNNAIINDNGVICVLKVRIACSGRKLGKSGGYRVIAIANRETQEVVLIEIYPKRGSASKVDLSNLELKNVLSVYLNEREESSLIQLDIDNKLEAI